MVHCQWNWVGQTLKTTDAQTLTLTLTRNPNHCSSPDPNRDPLIWNVDVTLTLTTYLILTLIVIMGHWALFLKLGGCFIDVHRLLVRIIQPQPKH